MKDPTLKDILDIIEFIRDNASTKSDLQQVEQRLEAKIEQLDTKIEATKIETIEHVDGFIALYRKHEIELAAVVSRQNRFDEKLNLIIKHLKLT